MTSTCPAPATFPDGQPLTFDVSPGKNMRKVMLFSILTAVISIYLTITSALQYSFLTGSAASSVKVIETQFINTAALNSDQSRFLKRNLIRLSGGEAYLSKLHHDLWWVSVLGFGFISLLSSFTAWLAFKANQSFKRDALKRAP